MKPKTLILMVVAVVCGLGASYMTSRLLAERAAPPPPPEVEKIQVVVARQKVVMGTLIKDPEKYFVWKSFTKGEEPKKAITNMDLLKDRRLNKPLTEEQFVTTEDLLDPKLQGLDSVLPPGMRAIALKVNAASVVAGFVLANSRVDVVNTIRHGEESYSQIILQNMLVLATDMQANRDPERQAMMSSTVTVAAKPEDAQKLRLAEAMGELSLILRGAEDDELVRSKAIRPRDVQRSSDGSISGSTEETAAAPLLPPSLPDAPSSRPTETAKGPESSTEPATAPPKTLTQVLYNGEAVTKTIFVVNEDGNVSTQVEKTGMEAPPRVEKKSTETDKEEKEGEEKATGEKAASESDRKKDKDKAPAGGKSVGAK